MATAQFDYLADLIAEIRNAGDDALAAMACRALDTLLHERDDDELVRWRMDADQ
jgi:hypothetical protein